MDIPGVTTRAVLALHTRSGFLLSLPPKASIGSRNDRETCPCMVCSRGCTHPKVIH